MQATISLENCVQQGLRVCYMILLRPSLMYVAQMNVERSEQIAACKIQYLSILKKNKTKATPNPHTKQTKPPFLRGRRRISAQELGSPPFLKFWDRSRNWAVIVPDYTLWYQGDALFSISLWPRYPHQLTDVKWVVLSPHVERLCCCLALSFDRSRQLGFSHWSHTDISEQAR